MEPILTNEAFSVLTDKSGPRLRAWAKARHERDPHGDLTAQALQQVMSECKYSAAETDVRFLKNLQLWHRTGRLARLLQGQYTFEDRVAEITTLKAQKKIPFGIHELVIDKNTGKLGSVIDYNVEKDEYVVVLNPFQMHTCKPSDLLKSGDK
jgi:hypothetical protein